MNKDNQASVLQKAIGQLPAFRAEDRIWEKIEAELDKDTAEKGRPFLADAIRELPKYKVAETSWEKLEERILDKEENKRKKPIAYTLSVAAFFLLLFGLLLLMEKKQRNGQSISQLAYSTETFDAFKVDEGTKDLERSLNEMLASHCQMEPETCRSPQFTELKKELADLDATLNELNKKYESSNNDPEIYKYLLRARKKQTEISKKLLHYFNN
jgi:hypothetical protein